MAFRLLVLVFPLIVMDLTLGQCPSRTLRGQPGDGFGHTVAAAGRVDGDNRDDFVVGCGTAGYVRVLSGLTGLQLHQFPPVPVPNTGFGHALPASVQNRAQWCFTIPGPSVFLGLPFFQQAFLFDGLANSGGATTSNATSAIIGNR